MKIFKSIPLESFNKAVQRLGQFILLPLFVSSYLSLTLLTSPLLVGALLNGFSVIHHSSLMNDKCPHHNETTHSIGNPLRSGSHWESQWGGQICIHYYDRFCNAYKLPVVTYEPVAYQWPFIAYQLNYSVEANPAEKVFGTLLIAFSILNWTILRLLYLSFGVRTKQLQTTSLTKKTCLSAKLKSLLCPTHIYLSNRKSKRIFRSCSSAHKIIRSIYICNLQILLSPFLCYWPHWIQWMCHQVESGRSPVSLENIPIHSWKSRTSGRYSRRQVKFTNVSSLSKQKRQLIQIELIQIE